MKERGALNMRNRIIHLALATALTATYALAQQSGSAQAPATTAPATQSPQTQPPSSTQPSGNPAAQPAAPGAQTGAAGAQQPATSAQAGQPGAKSDTFLQNEIEQAFRTEPSLANKVNVSVANNQVVLSGTVLTPTEKKTAQQVAEAYANGAPVVDNINISSSTSAAAAAAGTSSPTAGQAAAPPAGTAQPGTAGGVSGAAAGQAQPPAAGAQAGAAGAQTGAAATQPGVTGTQPGAVGAQTQSTQGAAGATTGNGTLTGDHLRADIQNALQRDPTLSSCSLTTNVTAEAVELAGTCPTAQEKQTAVRLAQSFAGNRRVVNRITVSGGAQGQSPQASPPQR